MTKKLPSETFCVLPWMHVAVTPSGSYRLCCNSDPKTNKIWKDEKTEHKFFKVAEEDEVANVWHSPDYIEFRRQFLAGERPATCERCFREEDAGMVSARMRYNEKWMRDDIELTTTPPADIRYVDIRLGNLCNLKCRMCNPWSSSKWAKDWNEVVDTSKTLEPARKLTEADMKWMEELSEWPEWRGTGKNFLAVADTVEEIYLTGGEPTLARSQYKLLGYCVENGLAKKIKLKYNTNLTNVPPEMIDLWKHFKRVQLNASIDAVGDRDRYIRYPSHWSKIQENFYKLSTMSNVDLQVHCTVQALNVVALPQLLDWMEDMGLTHEQLYLNILNHPYALNVRVLPEELKKRAVDQLANYLDWPKVDDTIKYMMAEDWHEKYWDEFVAYNKRTDKLQGMNLVISCPEFKGYI